MQKVDSYEELLNVFNDVQQNPMSEKQYELIRRRYPNDMTEIVSSLIDGYSLSDTLDIIDMVTSLGGDL